MQKIIVTILIRWKQMLCSHIIFSLNADWMIESLFKKTIFQKVSACLTTDNILMYIIL